MKNIYTKVYVTLNKTFISNIVKDREKSDIFKEFLEVKLIIRIYKTYKITFNLV
jgi:hypothetical protein